MQQAARERPEGRPKGGRGRRRALGLGPAAAAAAVTPGAAQRADAVPARDARKETEAQRLAARYRADAPDVQAFYRTNRYEH